jgi:hypothetical protein
MNTPTIIPQTAPEFTFGKMVLIGVAKDVSEKALARVPMVGNATIRSGAIKLLLAYVAYRATKGKSGIVGQGGQILATAWTIDAVEDIIAGTMRWVRARQGSSNDTNASVGMESPNLATI